MWGMFTVIIILAVLALICLVYSVITAFFTRYYSPSGRAAIWVFQGLMCGVGVLCVIWLLLYGGGM